VPPPLDSHSPAIWHTACTARSAIELAMPLEISAPMITATSSSTPMYSADV
jgi:hypothetical protein